MANSVSFSGMPFRFFCTPVRYRTPKQTDFPGTLTAQSSILIEASTVTASIEGPNASQFKGGLELTAWGPVYGPVPPPHPPVPGPRPAVTPVSTKSASDARTMVVRNLPANKPVVAIRGVTGYVITGTSNGTTPLTVVKGGYLEVSVTALPTVVDSNGNPIGSDGNPLVQGNNRFAASVSIQGTSWTPIELDAILNVVEIIDAPIAVAFIPNANSPERSVSSRPLLAGDDNGQLIAWSVAASLYPPIDQEYPIDAVLGPGDGPLEQGGQYSDVVAGELWMGPAQVVSTWNSHTDGGVFFGQATISAPYFATATDPNNPPSFTITQSFFNGSIRNVRTNVLYYTVVTS